MKLFKFLKRILIVLLVFVLLISVGYTYFISPDDYKFSNFEYTTDQIPSEFDHFKIAFFSDCNISTQEDVTRFEKIITELNTKTFDMVKIEFSVIRNAKSNKELISDYKKHQKYIIEKLLQKISENRKFINYGVPIAYLKLDKVALTSVDTFHHTFILKTEKLEEV